MDSLTVLEMQLKVLNFLKTHGKTVAVVLAILLSLGTGYGLGHVGGFPLVCPVPADRIVTQEKVVEKLVVDEKLVEQEVQRRVKEYESSIAKHTTKVTVSKPDGTTVTKETTDLHVNKKETDVQVKYVDRVVEKTVYQDKIVEKTVVVDNARNWRAGPLVGIAPQLLPVPSIGQVVYGAEVERRVLGQVWVGAWAVSSGSLGLTAKVEF